MNTYISFHDVEQLTIKESTRDGHHWTTLEIGEVNQIIQITLHHDGPLRITPDREPLLWLVSFDIDLAHRIQTLPSYPATDMQWEEDYQMELNLA